MLKGSAVVVIGVDRRGVGRDDGTSGRLPTRKACSQMLTCNGYW